MEILPLSYSPAELICNLICLSAGLLFDAGFYVKVVGPTNENPASQAFTCRSNL